MDIKQELGLSYKVVTADDFIMESPHIRGLINQYIGSKGAGDKESPVDDLMTLFNIAVGQPTFFLFLAKKDDSGVGLMSAHTATVSDKSGAMIHIGVVDNTVSKVESAEIVKEAMRCLFEWAKVQNVPTLFAQTHRSEKPFDKLLMKHGWNRVTTVYEKEIDHGRREESSK